MSTITADDIARLAAASPKFAAMIKHAQKEGFDENVPGTQAPADPNASAAGAYPANSAAPQPMAPVSAEEEYAAVPGEEEMGPEGEAPVEETPEDMGARAAQSFMMPVFEAAMSGDPNAQMILARAAGEIAGATTERAYGQSSQGGMPGQGAEAGAAQPQPIPTPEEEVANSIVAPVPPQAAAPNEQSDETGSENGKDEKNGKNGKNGKSDKDDKNGKNGKGGFPFKK
ncbi:MAG TPA: hypothetical protein VMW91_11265 [Desulfosporosinus sp.]|nr:hypothetical protein [Desulfosporosinus sp.]